ncbi:hypothetical protein [Vibrio sp. WXL210]|uniref:hypothetical protein n=1 Tax=Vibrio sp. WXL210 TaxID=3450709 RepID=UPI003EC6A7FC
MARKIATEKELEFDELAAFIEFYSSNVTGLKRDAPVHPSNCLAQGLEMFGKSKVLQGLKQAVNDIIEDSSSLNSEEIISLDKELASNGVVTLSTLRKRYSSAFKKIITRGCINDETEYYLINGLLCDSTGNLPVVEQELLSKLVLEFEKGA